MTLAPCPFCGSDNVTEAFNPDLDNEKYAVCLSASQDRWWKR